MKRVFRIADEIVAISTLGLFLCGCSGANAQSRVQSPAPSFAATLMPDVDADRARSTALSTSTDLSSSSFSDSAPANTSGADENGLPEAPDPQSGARADRAPSTKRILGIIPNFRTVSTDEHLPPQTAKQKFLTATEDSFDYSSIFIPAALAGYSLGTNADPEFGGGGVGYGRYLWHAVVDQTAENYLVEAIFPSITHEDARFYTQGRGSAGKRAGYALTRVVNTRSDAGKQVFNISEIVGSGASAGLSTLYYPSRERSFGNTGKQWGLNIGVDAISFIFKEFWPDVNQKFFGIPKSESTGTP